MTKIARLPQRNSRDDGNIIPAQFNEGLDLVFYVPDGGDAAAPQERFATDGGLSKVV